MAAVGITKSARVRNETGSTIAAGSLVYVSGWNETHRAFLITKADADASGRRAHYILRTALTTATNGTGYKTYLLTGQNTAAASAVGDPVYLDTTAGGWTLTAPTGASSIVQQIGVVTIDHASTGAIQFDILEPVSIGTNELQAEAVTGAKLALRTVAAKTANYPVVRADNGSTFTNAGASGTITFALPAAVAGMWFKFHVMAAFELRIDPDGTETIALPSTGAQGAAGKYLFADAVGEWVHVECVTTGQWQVMGYAGTFTSEA